MATPLQPTDLDEILKALALPAAPAVVALSGGPDSFALTWLLHQLGRAPLTALVVEHGLRPESAQEAQHVAAHARALGVACEVLPWTGPKPTTAIMAAAREARYDLLLNRARALGAQQLFVAHHADDQRETIALRAEKQSGWRGLAGMPVLSERRGLTMVRPLLGTSKVQLIATCTAAGLPVVDDPSNRNPKYARARLRAGVLPEVDGAIAARRNAELESWRTSGLFTEHPGWVEVNSPADVPPALWAALLQLVGQQDYAPSEAVVARVLARSAKRITLGGCWISFGAQKALITRESHAIAPQELPFGLSSGVYWDRRFWLPPGGAESGTLAPLGAGAWRHLPEKAWIEALPAPVRPSLPALWQENRPMRVLQGHYLPNFHPLRQKFW